MADHLDKISGETVRADFNAVNAVLHYARAAHFLGLWESEQKLIEIYFPDKSAPLLEAGCGAGRVAVGLCHLGYEQITAFDFAPEMIDQAISLAREQGLTGLDFHIADATDLRSCHLIRDVNRLSIAGAAAHIGPTSRHVLSDKFAGVLFLFNGLMQIPGGENRRRAMRELCRVCRPGAPFLFTTHDREASAAERASWRREAGVWARGEQDPRLVEFGDRYFEHDHGRTFMHLPVREEVLADLDATGWAHVEDALRDDLARERRAVRDFSDNCRFWVARKS